VQQPSIYSFRLDLGTKLSYTVELPLPMVSSSSVGKTRIARKPSWVEHSALVALPTNLLARPESMYPMRFQKK